MTTQKGLRQIDEATNNCSIKNSNDLVWLMARFSKHFKLDLAQAELDFVDIRLNRDTPLFVDPYAISIRDDSWSAQCNNEIVAFFQTAIDYIRTQQAGRAKTLLNGLGEPNETCLGLSRRTPRGRGVSGRQALNLYDALAGSAAAQTGQLSALADSDLFVEGIGRDKMSDITTNIIRRHLIAYTQQQCKLHSIPLQRNVPSGRLWDGARHTWTEEYVELPVVGGKKILLVPKFSVRRRLSLESQEFYNHYMLNFLQEDHLRRDTSLVHVLKKGKRVVYKTELKEKHPLNKDDLFRFAREHPNVLEMYKRIKGAQGPIEGDPLDELFDESVFATVLKKRLQQIPPGRDHATDFHTSMIGALEFIFYPNLICPQKEEPIAQGTKRIDISYVNAARDGFFYRAHTAHQIASNRVMVECKNYSDDPVNPEIDQLLGRFSINRGKLGLLVCRVIGNRELMFTRCREAAVAGQGFILPLCDNDINEFLDLIIAGQRSEIDTRLERMLSALIA